MLAIYIAKISTDETAKYSSKVSPGNDTFTIKSKSDEKPNIYTSRACAESKMRKFPH